MTERTGRIKSAPTVHREIRRTLNKYGATIAEKLLAKALTGDANALVACGQLLVEANRNPPIARRKPNKQ